MSALNDKLEALSVPFSVTANEIKAVISAAYISNLNTSLIKIHGSNRNSFISIEVSSITNA